MLVFVDVATAGGCSSRTKATNLRGHCFTAHLDEELEHLAKTDLEDKILSCLLGSDLKKLEKAATSPCNHFHRNTLIIFDEETPRCHDDG